MSAAVHHPRERYRPSQAGVTLIELLAVIAIAGVILVPVAAWLYDTVQHQDSAQHLLRNASGTGYLGSHFSRDVQGASEVLVGNVASDCDGGGDGAGGDVVVSLVPSGSAHRVVYTEAEASRSEHMSLWRRECDAGGAVAATEELFERIVPGSAGAECLDGSNQSGACDQDDSRRVRFELEACPTRPIAAAAACDPSARTERVELQALRRITPGYDHLASTGPIAQILVSPRVGYLSDTFTFDASDSRGIEGPGATVEWEFPTIGNGITVSGVTTQQTFGVVGNHEVRLRVTDGQGGVNVATVTVRVLNRFPIANAEVRGEGASLVFDASGSVHPDGLTLDYYWDFGGGLDATDQVVPNPFPPGAEGRRRAVLWVTDSAGNSDTATVVVDFGTLDAGPITISPSPIDTPNKLPTVGSVGGDAEPFDVTFTSAENNADWTWRLIRRGSGETVATSAEAVFVHNFGDGDAGDYEIVRVGADGLARGEPVPFRVNAAPWADFDVVVAAAGSPTRFLGGESSDVDGEVRSWRWEFGGPGWTASGPDPSFVYPGPGTFVVVLVVTDDDGATTRTERPIRIPGPVPRPSPPTWSGGSVTWAAVPGAERYRVTFCVSGPPTVVEVAATDPRIATPGPCEGALTATLQVMANGQWSLPSAEAAP